MPLPDQDTGVMDRLSHTRLEDKGLKSSLEEVLDSQSQDVIEFVLAFVQNTIPVHSSKKCFTFKDTTWVLLIKGKKHSSCVTDTAQSILNPP